MQRPALDILQISTADVLGGAERVAYELHRSYRRLGHRSRLLVGRRRTDDPDVRLLTHEHAGDPWRRFWWRRHARLQPNFTTMRGARWLARWYQRLAEPAGWLDTLRGVEDFHYPGAWDLLDRLPRRPDIIHAHNLHGKYFDLRALPQWSRAAPLMLTLHDAWLMTGHCAHSMDCTRWQSGCGACPDLSIYPAIRRDATARNHRRKADIFRQCRCYVATPSRWLMDRAHQSILAPAIIESKVIPNGVDTTVFHPGNPIAARDALRLPKHADILLFAAYGITKNTFKDYETLRAAATRLGKQADRRAPDRPLLILALGDDGPSQRVGRAEIRLIPHVSNPHIVAEYHRATDFYVHASKADTFPTSILEAMACGRPVVATAVGGIPEQVVCLLGRTRGQNEATGLLVPPGDADAMASGIDRLLGDDALRSRLGRNAARRVDAMYRLETQVEAYLNWYEAITGRSIRSPATAQQQSKEQHERVRKEHADKRRDTGNQPGPRKPEVVAQGTTQ